MTFRPDTLEQALSEGFEPCFYCLGTVADLLDRLGEIVAAPADVVARDRGDGEMFVRWNHPEAGNTVVSFEIHAATRPEELFGTARAVAGGGATQAILGGFGEGGDVYVCVVARRRFVRSSPSPVVRLRMAAAPTVVRDASRLPSVRPASGAGLAFPFTVDAAGHLAWERDDARIRSKIRQLLLTSPGERVNLPEYGSPLRELLFDPLDDVLVATTEFGVAATLRRFLGHEIEVQSVVVGQDGERLDVDITYVLRRDLSAESVRLTLPLPGGFGG